jgi:hypothetical protein
MFGTPSAVATCWSSVALLLQEQRSFFGTLQQQFTLADAALGTGSFCSGSDHFTLPGPFFFRSGENATVSLPTLSVSYQ